MARGSGALALGEHVEAWMVYASRTQRHGLRVYMSTPPTETTTALDPQSWLHRHGDVLFRYAVARVRDRQFAEDLVQETFLAAWRSRENFAGRSAEQTWLVGILRHKIIDHLRRRREASLPEAGEDEAHHDLIDRLFDRAGHWKSGPKPWKDPAQAVEQAEFFEVLHRCLSALPERHGEVYTLYQLEQQSSEQVCRALGITPSNFGVIMYRIRIRLRQCLEVNWFAAG